MWARLDDALIDHPKFVRAGLRIGNNGKAIAIGFWTVALLWSNRFLTDGFVPSDILTTWNHVDNPAAVADALVFARLFDKTTHDGVVGFRIHDYAEHNPTAAIVKRRRKEDRMRKADERAGSNGRARA